MPVKKGAQLEEAQVSRMCAGASWTSLSEPSQVPDPEHGFLPGSYLLPMCP